jgi:DNA-binding HxlR family transcriptional regulator
MKRKCLYASPCPIARALDSIGDWWTLLILRDAFKGIKRFNAIQKSLGIPRNILTARLRMLVERDILSVAPASDGSVYREYVLTEKGQDLVPVLVALRQWGERHLASPEDGAEASDLQGIAAPADSANYAMRDAAEGTAGAGGEELAMGEDRQESADELAEALAQVLAETSALRGEPGRFVGPERPRAAY